MSSGQRTVLFLGSVSATVIGQDVRDSAAVAALEKQLISLRLRATVVASNKRSEEVFGAVGSSDSFGLHTASGKPRNTSSEGAAALLYPLHLHNAFFTPLMVELAQDPAADGMPETSDSHSDEDDGAADDTGAEGGLLSATVHLSVHAWRRGVQPCEVVSKSVRIHSLNKYAARDTCAVVRLNMPASRLSQLPRTSGKGPSSLSTAGTAEVPTRDAALSLYVMLRVVDLSNRVCAAEDAVDGLREQLGLPQPVPRLSLEHAAQVTTPYGIMPLAEMYRHYCMFYSHYYSRAVKPDSAVALMFHRAGGDAVTSPEAEIGSPKTATAASFPHRWNTLTSICLNRVLLGEAGFAPVLLTLAHCCNLQSIVADGNQLSDVTCARMCALLSCYRYLRKLSLRHNPIYEGGACQLLQLVRRNRRLHSVTVDGHWCSAEVQDRIAAFAEASRNAIARDPLNPFSTQYAYITSPTALHPLTLKHALSVWVMLTATPVGDVDVWVRNTTTRDMDQYIDEAETSRRQASKDAADAAISAVPAAARAPLLNEIMRTVYVGVCIAVPDPLVRSVFADVEEARRKRTEHLASRSDVVAAMATKASHGSGSSSGSNSSDDDDQSSDSLGDADRQQRQAADAAKRKDSAASAAAKGEDINGLPAEVAAALDLTRALTVEGGLTLPLLIAQTEEEIYSASFLKIVVTTLRAIVSGSPWEEVTVVLRRIGRLHRTLGVRLEDHWLALHIFVKGLKVCLGTEDFTSDRLTAFLLTLVLGLRTAFGDESFEQEL